MRKYAHSWLYKFNDSALLAIDIHVPVQSSLPSSRFTQSTTPMTSSTCVRVVKRFVRSRATLTSYVMPRAKVTSTCRSIWSYQETANVDHALKRKLLTMLRWKICSSLTTMKSWNKGKHEFYQLIETEMSSLWRNFHNWVTAPEIVKMTAFPF